MKHYVEQYRDCDGMITGRTDITDYTFLMRDRIEARIGNESYSGYSIRRITSERVLPCFPPIEKNSTLLLNPRKGMNSNNMTADEFQAYIKQQSPVAEGKPKPEFKRPAEQPSSITADQFRLDHVDTEEHGHQKRCVKWFKWDYPMHVIASVPNAAKRTPTQIQTMLDEGLLAGFPDLIIPVPNTEFHGLYIEMKVRKKGRISDAQARIHAYLRAMGYEVLIPLTFEEFAYLVTDYMSKVPASYHL